MSNGPDGSTPEALPHELRKECGRSWPPSGAATQRPRALESTTLTALLLLFLVSADDRDKGFPASARVLDLVSELQHHRDDASRDVGLRASLLSRLSAALANLRRDIE